jgi:hypothetical protein
LEKSQLKNTLRYRRTDQTATLGGFLLVSEKRAKNLIGETFERKEEVDDEKNSAHSLSKSVFVCFNLGQ